MNFMNILTASSGTADVMTIDKQIISFFNGLFNNNGFGNLILVFLSMLLTIILVGIIGFEREYQGHNAGLRTHVLVALGSCIIMIISMYSLGYRSDGNMETMRLAATVCTGIGFLGAGVIIQTGTTVKGLTTAATLWMSMSIGLACGSGNFTIAILGTLFAVICLVFFVKLEKFVNRKNPIIYLLIPVESNAVKQIIDLANKRHIEIKSFETFVSNYGNQQAMRYILKLSKTQKDNLESFIKDISENIDNYEIKAA